MVFRAKIQPIGGDVLAEETAFKPAVRQVRTSRLKNLFERQLTPTNVTGRDPPLPRDKPSSVYLGKMVEDNIEGPDSGKAKQRCGGLNMCNCFFGSGTDSSGEESSDEESSEEELEIIKRLVRCTSLRERNLVRNVKEAAKQTEQSMRKEDSRLKIVADALVILGYDAEICKSHWDESNITSCPAGEYEYLDVLIGGERLLIDIDFKSHFEIAHPTNTYKSISQSLPYIFVGKMDRLLQLVIVISDAAKQSMKKKKLYVPPWTKQEYVLTKWLAPHVRANRRQG